MPSSFIKRAGERIRSKLGERSLPDKPMGYPENKELSLWLEPNRPPADEIPVVGHYEVDPGIALEFERIKRMEAKKEWPNPLLWPEDALQRAKNEPAKMPGQWEDSYEQFGPEATARYLDLMGATESKRGDTSFLTELTQNLSGTELGSILESLRKGISENIEEYGEELAPVTTKERDFWKAGMYNTYKI